MCTNNNLELSLEVVPMFSCKVKHEDIYGIQHTTKIVMHKNKIQHAKKYQCTYM